MSCQELLSSRVREYRKCLQSEQYRFVPTLDLLRFLFPDPLDATKCVLNECCIGQIMTHIDNTTQINSYNPQRSIYPYMRTASSIADNNKPKKRKEFTIAKGD